MYVQEKWAVSKKFSPSGPRYKNGVNSRHSCNLKMAGRQSRRRALGHWLLLKTPAMTAMPMLTYNKRGGRGGW